MKTLLVFVTLLLGLIACSEPMSVEDGLDTGDPIVAVEDTQPMNDTDAFQAEAYPVGEGAYPVSNPVYDPGYPAPAPTLPANLSDVPPNPDVILPQNTDETLAVIGGALIQEVNGTGYVPLKPIKLYLGEVLTTENGVQSHIKRSSSSPTAELFDTGVFIFQDIPPGKYGLIVDLMHQFEVKRDGEPLLITIEGGEVIDLGQVIVTIPGID